MAYFVVKVLMFAAHPRRVPVSYMQMPQQDRKCATRTVSAPLRSAQNRGPPDLVGLLMLPEHACCHYTTFSKIGRAGVEPAATFTPPAYKAGALTDELPPGEGQNKRTAYPVSLPSGPDHPLFLLA